ncbi:MAG: class I SAM-dependent methyltransferase [Pyrinomonadaceae bacterium]|nr:class I SAM-dependent methyltransferase [Pyrinomonadaceae bacterium]
MNFELVQRLEIIKTAAVGKSVLHLGCTNHPYTKEAIDADMLLHDSLSAVAKEVYGFDMDQEGIDLLSELGNENLYLADLEKLGEVELDKQFDLVIAGEMIEHLNNPGLFLEGIKKFLKPEGELLITTINAYCAVRFLQYGLRGKGGSIEPVHPDHVAYYSFRTLSLLLDRHGYLIDEFLFYDIGIDHRPHNPWYINFANDVSVKISKQLADGIIAFAKLKDE